MFIRGISSEAISSCVHMISFDLKVQRSSRTETALARLKPKEIASDAKGATSITPCALVKLDFA